MINQSINQKERNHRHPQFLKKMIGINISIAANGIISARVVLASEAFVDCVHGWLYAGDNNASGRASTGATGMVSRTSRKRLLFFEWPLTLTEPVETESRGNICFVQSSALPRCVVPCVTGGHASPPSAYHPTPTAGRGLISRTGRKKSSFVA
jgi:hypothetical protein